MLKQLRSAIALTVLVTFIGPSIQVPVYAQTTLENPLPGMPKPGVRLGLSPEFIPAILKGITIHPENPFLFDFIIHRGDKVLSNEEKQVEYKKLIKYFLASLAIPDEDQWVNLSPYEKDRIIKDDFGKTLMGRDLLGQDYILKQITASLIYPEEDLGKKFWSKVYAKAQEQYGTTNIPVNTFNKVWIIPDEALIYEKGNTAYVLKNHLKVMLEEDYLALSRHSEGVSPTKTFGDELRTTEESKGTLRSFATLKDDKTHTLGSQVVRELILPALEKEVNEGKNFAPLRQVYSGMLLATWFKRTLKKSLLGMIYADKTKIKGIDQDTKNNEAIYQRYLRAYKKGVFNYIKEDVDKYTHEEIPRKYFSGGTVNDFAKILETTDKALLGDQKMREEKDSDDLVLASLKQATRPQIPRRGFLGVMAATVAGAGLLLSPEESNGQQLQGRIYDDFMTGQQALLDFPSETKSEALAEGQAAQNLMKIILTTQEQINTNPKIWMDNNFKNKFKAVLIGEMMKDTDQETIRIMSPDWKHLEFMSLELFLVKVVAKYLSTKGIFTKPLLATPLVNGKKIPVWVLLRFFKIIKKEVIDIDPHEIWSDQKTIKMPIIQIGEEIGNQNPRDFVATTIYGNLFYDSNTLLETVIVSFQMFNAENQRLGFDEKAVASHTVNKELEEAQKESNKNRREFVALRYSMTKGREMLSRLPHLQTDSLVRIFWNLTLRHEARHFAFYKEVGLVDKEIDGFLAGMRTGYLGWMWVLINAYLHLWNNNPNPDYLACASIVERAVQYIQKHPKEFPMIKETEAYRIKAKLWLIDDSYKIQVGDTYVPLLQHMADAIYMEHHKPGGAYKADKAMAAKDTAMSIVDMLDPKKYKLNEEPEGDYMKKGIVYKLYPRDSSGKTNQVGTLTVQWSWKFSLKGIIKYTSIHIKFIGQPGAYEMTLKGEWNKIGWEVAMIKVHDLFEPVSSLVAAFVSPNSKDGAMAARKDAAMTYHVLDIVDIINQKVIGIKHDYYSERNIFYSDVHRQREGSSEEPSKPTLSIYFRGQPFLAASVTEIDENYGSQFISKLRREPYNYHGAELTLEDNGYDIFLDVPPQVIQNASTLERHDETPPATLATGMSMPGTFSTEAEDIARQCINEKGIRKTSYVILIPLHIQDLYGRNEAAYEDKLKLFIRSTRVAINENVHWDVVFWMNRSKEIHKITRLLNYLNDVHEFIYSKFKETVDKKAGTITYNLDMAMEAKNIDYTKESLHRPDAALLHSKALINNPGGIDMNSANLNLRIRRDGNGVPLPASQQDLAQLSNIEGLVPDILSIEPASQTPLFAKLQTSP